MVVLVEFWSCVYCGVLTIGRCPTVNCMPIEYIVAVMLTNLISVGEVSEPMPSLKYCERVNGHAGD